MTTRTDSDFDVVVAGAGMIGCTCAVAIAQSGVRVALVDPGPINFKHSRPNPIRVSAVNLATENILRALGTWSVLKAENLSPFRQIDVWDAGSSGQITFSAANAGLAHLGHIIENEAITSALTTCLSRLGNVTCFASDSVETFESDHDGISIVLASKQNINGKLLVGADGTESRVRSLAEISVEKTPYNHQAIVATVTTELPHRETARQRFLDTGPLAFLPLQDGHSSIVWSCSPQRFDELNGLDDAAFSTALTEAFENRLGAITLASSRSSFPLISQHANQYIESRIALVGDAAHSVHPLAGLGANLGFADAAALAELIDHAHHTRKDIGNRSLLRRYERWRRGQNQLVTKVVDALYYTFGSNRPDIQSLRGFGFSCAQNIPLLKRLIIDSATGCRGDQPRLAQSNLSTVN
jgi:2-octaprenylphenol hydroxylase